MAFETEQPASAGSDPASEARAFLEAAGVRGITIAGGGEIWRVSVGWNEPERFVVAFSEKNPTTPNDPLYLAEQALAVLIRNEGPCPHVASVTELPRETPAPETDAVNAELWAPADEPLSLGEEILEGQPEGQLANEDEAGQDSGDDIRQDTDASATNDADASVLVRETETIDHADIHRGEPASDNAGLVASYPGVAILPDDLSIALALVIEAVAAEEETRVAAVEALQAIDLQAMSDYGNWPAGVAMDANVEAGAKRFMAFAQQRTAIQSHSLALRRSARDHRARGDLSALQGMRDGVAVGWP